MKQTETVRAENTPAVSQTQKMKADSIACIYGVELFTLGWIAGMLSAFFGYSLQTAVMTLAAAGIALTVRRKQALPPAYFPCFAERAGVGTERREDQKG